MRLRDDLGVEPAADVQKLHRRILDQDASLLSQSSPTSTAVPTTAPQGRTVTAAMLFTDLVDSTAISGRIGDPQIDVVRRELFTMLRQLITRHGGAEVKTLGDGIMAAFPSATDALECAAAMQRENAQRNAAVAAEPLSLRIGMSAGDVLLEDMDYFGQPVVEAARLCALAEGDEILLPDRVVELAGSRAGYAVESIGTHFLKGIDDPIPVSLVLWAPGHVPAPARIRHRDHGHRYDNLPAPTTRFIGRSASLDAICERVRAARLVTVTGPGGAGKTRLALEAARVLLDRFDITCLVELAAIDDPAGVPHAVAAALNIREDPSRPLEVTVFETVGDRSLLLLLDNCEHLVGACADLTAQLLRTCPHARVLATSRERLRLSGETDWRVEPMMVPDPETVPPLDVLRTIESVELFVDRAKDAKPSFSLDEASGPAVAQICRRLEGIPLAIELAAARVRLFSAGALLEQLDRPLELGRGARDLPQRQQTLRSTIEWSWELLEEREKGAFARFGVFAGGADLESVGAVVGEADALDLVESLLDKSLVSLATDTAEPRFVMLETIREFALERLEDAGLVRATQDRHARSLANLAEQAAPELTRSDQAAWLERLDRNDDNLRAALRWAIDHDVDLAHRMGGALWRFWEARGRYSEGRRWLDAVLALDADRVAERRDRASVLLGAGYLAFWQFDYGVAIAHHLAAADMARELDERLTLVIALNGLGAIARHEDRHEDALAIDEEALALSRELGDSWAVASSLRHLANAAEELLDLDRAQELCVESLALFREVGDHRSTVLMAANLGQLAIARSDYEAGEAFCRESLLLARELGDRFGVAFSLVGLAEIDQCLGRFDTARSAFDEAWAISREIGEKGLVAFCMNQLGKLERQTGDLEEARQLSSQALDEYGRLHDRHGIANANTNLADIARLRGDNDEAAERYLAALDRWDELPPELIAPGLEGLAMLSAQRGDALAAARFLGAAAATRRDGGPRIPPSQQADHDRLVGELRQALGSKFVAAAEEGEAESLAALLALFPRAGAASDT
jgi:predicted ATPase/class 3 adenylate cyclase